ncbi:MAG: hypothetical protein IJU72_02615 [Bacteroidales bacterium]|nr:hypothetical protein [Bacteroidales bacterium]
MKRILTTILIVLLMGAGVSLQGQALGSFADRLYVGGSMGLSFGGRVTQIDLLPIAGVWLFRQWTLGVGGRYSFRNERFNLQTGTLDSQTGHTWGASAFTQVLPIPSLHDAFGIGIDGGPLLHAEYERLWVATHGARRTTGLVLLGVGWRQRAGSRAAVCMMALWNLTRTAYSPYPDNPVLRFCITF